MTQDYPHPITPPPELVEQWARFQGYTDPQALWFCIATEAARWGADQELEACCEWLEQNCDQWKLPYSLRAARRPKPPSLKEQALEAMGRFNANAHTRADEMAQDFDTIRRALEQLDD